MARVTFVLSILVAGLIATSSAQAADRIASVGMSPFSSESDANGEHGMLIDLIHAMDTATNSSTEIVLRPFARSLVDTAAGLADFHLPLIQHEGTPPPAGLRYVMDVDFGQVPFVIYSRKSAPFDADTIGAAKEIEVESSHESFFPFAVHATNCVICSLDKILRGRTDALIVAEDVVDPLLRKPEYKDIHRALFRIYTVRALVPASADSTATRRYLVEGVRRLKETGEIWKITRHDTGFSDWQP
jgi:polar amino acid transport system substrate-binding protein